MVKDQLITDATVVRAAKKPRMDLICTQLEAQWSWRGMLAAFLPLTIGGTRVQKIR